MGHPALYTKVYKAKVAKQMSLGFPAPGLALKVPPEPAHLNLHLPFLWP